MSAETVRDFEALEAQAATILETFKGKGFERVAPDILQPADVFLDEIGESLRGRTYVFMSPGGEELCLRPDLTIPACRLFLERHPEASAVARYCYNGPAFRYQPGGATAVRPREFRQAGIELFGANEESKSEAEILGVVIEAIKTAGVTDFVLRVGDLGLFFALLDALDIPERWRKRLSHHFWRPRAFHEVLWTLCKKPASAIPKAIRPLIAKIDPEDADTAEELVAQYLDDNEIPLIGARTLPEITKRILEIAADAHEEPLMEESAELIENYLSISGPPKAAGARISDLLGNAGLDLGPAMKTYMKRLDIFTKAGIDLTNAHFNAEFGRNLEYYTGFVFQIEIEGLGRSGQIAGGGRYDSLIQRLGAPKNVTAVGAAIHTERLLAASQGALREEETGEEDL